MSDKEDEKKPPRKGSGGRPAGGKSHGGAGANNVAPGTKGRGACPSLGTHMFDLGHQDSASQMKETLTAIAKYVGHQYGVLLACCDIRLSSHIFGTTWIGLDGLMDDGYTRSILIV